MYFVYESRNLIDNSFYLGIKEISESTSEDPMNVFANNIGSNGTAPMSNVVLKPICKVGDMNEATAQIANIAKTFEGSIYFKGIKIKKIDSKVKADPIVMEKPTEHKLEVKPPIKN
jgi:hypothetical protein